jgi:hypothetical protein
MGIGLHGLGSNLYHWTDDSEYRRWMREHLDFSNDVMVTSHVSKKKWKNSEARRQLESCEKLTEDKRLQGGLTPWVDDVT